MIFVSINRPLGKDNVGLLGCQDPAVLVVTLVGDFHFTVDLPGKDGSRLQNLASLLGFRGANGACLFIRLALDAPFPAGEIEDYNFVPKVGVPSHGAATSGLW